MKKSIFLSMLLCSTTLFSMNHQMSMNHNHHQKAEDKMYDEKDVKLAKKGKKIFETLCDSSKFKEFETKELANEFIKQNCQNLDSQKIQAVLTYLYIPKLANEKSQMIDIPKDAKCPVCGMFVAKYEKWASVIKTTEKSFYFDGVIDMMKFYFEPDKYEKNIKLSKDDFNIEVTDYYTLQAIDAKRAFYVSQSNIYGPMGKELIPFKTESQAKDFLKEHNAKEILKFDEITKEHLKR